MNSQCAHDTIIESGGKEVCEECGECLTQQMFSGRDKNYTQMEQPEGTAATRAGKWHLPDSQTVQLRKRNHRVLENGIAMLRSLYTSGQCSLAITRQAIWLLDEYQKETRPASLASPLLLACVYGAFRLMCISQSKLVVCGLRLADETNNKQLPVTRKKLARAYTLLLRNTPTVPELKTPITASQLLERHCRELNITVPKDHALVDAHHTNLPLGVAHLIHRQLVVEYNCSREEANVKVLEVTDMKVD